MKKFKFKYILLLLLSFVIQSCLSKPPESPDNICLIFKEKRSWYKAAKETETRWKLPPYVLMAIIYQESSFKSDAKPEREKVLGFIPWSRPSSAVGYSQALSNTWSDYIDETGNKRAKRRNFVDSADFIGWYASKGYYQGFERTDARSLYLAYHEGQNGWSKETFKNKEWLIEVAKTVERNTNMFNKQLKNCEGKLNKKGLFGIF